MKVLGKIIAIRPKGGETHIDVDNGVKQVKAIIPAGMFCPVMKGDAIQGYIDDETGIFLEQPLIRVFGDIESVRSLIARAIRVTDLEDNKNNGSPMSPKYISSEATRKAVKFLQGVKVELLDSHVEQIDDNAVCKWISACISNKSQARAVQELVMLHDSITTNNAVAIISIWRDKLLKRQLYLLGLTKRDIIGLERYSLGLTEIFQRLKTEPYTLLPLDVRKCYAVAQRLKLPSPTLDVLTLRELYLWATKRGLNAIPLSKFTDARPIEFTEETKQRFRDDYRCEFVTVDGVEYLLLEHHNNFRLGYQRFVDFVHPPNFPFKPIKPNTRSTLLRESDIIGLDEEQISALEVAGESRICCITGKAGTGKTTLIARIYSMYENEGYETKIMAFTGKAVDRVKEVLSGIIGDKTVMTIDTFLNSNLSPEVIIIDEASMMSMPLFYQLLTAIPETTRLILVGDKRQLPPIESGNPFTALMSNVKVPCIHLQTDHRRGKTDMGLCLERVIDGKLPGSGESFTTIYNVSFQYLCAYLDMFDKANIPIEDLTVVTPKLADVDEINDYFIRKLRPKSPKQDDRFFVGQRVMLTQNEPDHNVFNGSVGHVIDIEEKCITVFFGWRYIRGENTRLDIKFPFQSDDYVEEPEPQRRPFTTELLINAWALTVHKSQGSEFKFTVFYLPNNEAQGDFICNELIYTAMSRAKKRLDVIAGCSEENFMNMVRIHTGERYPMVLNA